MDKTIERIIDKTHDEFRPIFVAYLNQLEDENVNHACARSQGAAPKE